MQDYILLKKFGAGLHSKKVLLLQHRENKQDKIVAKYCDLTRKKSIDRFNSEIRILKHLTFLNCPFVPKLLDVDKKRGIIYMTYCCGEAPGFFEIKAYKDIVKKRMQELNKNYQVVRYKNNGTRKIFFPVNNNIIINHKNGQVYLIDFGQPDWRINGTRVLNIPSSYFDSF